MQHPRLPWKVAGASYKGEVEDRIKNVINGVKAATYFSFTYKSRLLLYNAGYDTADFAHRGPGWVLLAYLIQYAIADGFKVFDFLQGDEAYKYHFGSQDIKVMRTVIYNQQV